MCDPGVHRRTDTGRPRDVVAGVDPVDLAERARPVYALRVAQRRVWDPGDLGECQGSTTGQGQSR